MKVSIIASRVLAGLSIAAAFAGIAVANTGSANTGSIQQPTITDIAVSDSAGFNSNFQQNGTGNWQFNNTNSNLNLSFDATEIRNDNTTKLNNLDINANNVTITGPIGGYFPDELGEIVGDLAPTGQAFSFNINAQQVTFDSNAFVNIYKDSNITGDTTFQNGAMLNVIGHNLNIIGNANFQGDGSGFHMLQLGKINISENLTMTNEHFQFNAGAQSAVQNGTLPNTGSNQPDYYNSMLSNWSFTDWGIYVGKDANITNSQFGFFSADLPLGQMNLIHANQFNADVLTSNQVGTITYFKDISSLLTNTNILRPNLYNLQIEITNGNSLNGVTYTLNLSEDGKTLYINGQLSEEFAKQDLTSLKSVASSLITTEQDYITQAQTQLTQIEGNLTSQKASLESQLAMADEATKAQLQQQINQITNELEAIANAQTDLTDRNNALTDTKNQVNTATESNIKDIMLEALAPSINAGDYSLANNILEAVKIRKDDTLFGGVLFDMNEKLTPIVSATKNSGNTGESLKILSSIAGSSLHTQQVMQVITNQRFFKDTRDSARSATNFTDASSSMMTAINVSNDMAISSRIARANNPYQSLSKEKFAASGTTGTDGAYSYYETYNAAVWANAFGGANIIDGESGGLYGISIGVDGNVTDNVLLGIYATYANAELQDTLLSQESDNFQIGVYSQIKIAPTWELNLRAYGQLGQTDQRVSNIAGINTSDFDKKFFGISANVGKVFDMDNGFFLKPFGGVNYYYSHTPSYTERGTILAQSVESNTNNSVSLELGLEARKYFSSSSYLFVTPKIEQYIINNGDDYVGRFVGSSTSFSIAGEDKKKTYGQLVIGGNLEITDALSLNAGIGAKQILAGKVDSKNETYISGNVGIKYRF